MEYPNSVLLSKSASQPAQVTVCISLYNYQDYICETLDSVRAQTFDVLDLVIVEDRSTDDSLIVAGGWIQQYADRFNRIELIRHERNGGLARARNTAISRVETPYVFILDADNLLYPRCVERCVEVLENDPAAAMAYPMIERFGEERGVTGNVVWKKSQFKAVNRIDAMSLIRRSALLQVSGYSHLEEIGFLGWEDYEIWCKFIDNGLYGVPVSEVLARYRMHSLSMLNSISSQEENAEKLRRELILHHPWLKELEIENKDYFYADKWINFSPHHQSVYDSKLANQLHNNWNIKMTNETTKISGEQIAKLSNRSIEFDWEIYVQDNDLYHLKSFEEAKLHWLKFGKARGFASSEYSFYAKNKLNPQEIPESFDWKLYLESNPDIADLGYGKWQVIRYFLKGESNGSKRFSPLSDEPIFDTNIRSKDEEEESRCPIEIVSSGNNLPDLFPLRLLSPSCRTLIISCCQDISSVSATESWVDSLLKKVDHIQIVPTEISEHTLSLEIKNCNNKILIRYPSSYVGAASFLHVLQSSYTCGYDFVCWLNVDESNSKELMSYGSALLDPDFIDSNIGLVSSCFQTVGKTSEQNISVRRFLGTFLPRFFQKKPDTISEIPGGPVICISSLISQELRSLPIKPRELVSTEHPKAGEDTIRIIIGLLLQNSGLDSVREKILSDSLLSNSSSKLELVDDYKTKMIAFYLPQFHPIDENDVWWGKGFTEWTNVVRAKPLFRGHCQPRLPADLGFYDLRLKEVQEAQAKLAKQYGIYGFCYYYYWFDGKKLLNRPIENMLSSGKPDFPFCICWANENWSRNWDGQNRHVLLEQNYSDDSSRRFIHDVIPFLKDKRYIRHNGKPTLIIYRIKAIPNWLETAQIWREECRDAGVGEIHLCAVRFALEPLEGQPEDHGLDAYVLFPPHEVERIDIKDEQISLHKDFNGEIFQYDAVVGGDLSRFENGYPWPVHRAAMMGWDNTPRRLTDSRIFVGCTPSKFRYWLQGILEQEVSFNLDKESFVFINAWNEWAEGTFLEPDQRFGTAYLEAVKSAVLSLKSLRLRSKIPKLVCSKTTSDIVETVEYPEINDGNRILDEKLPSILLCAHISGHQLFGGERSFLDVLKAISKMKVNIFVTLPSGNNKSYVQSIREYSNGTYIFHYPQWMDNRALDESLVLQFSDIIAQHGIDVVHANTIVLLEPLVAARRMNRIPIIHARELITLDEPLRKRMGLSVPEIVQRVFESSDYLIANSKATMAAFSRNDRTFYAPNVVDQNELNLDNKILDKKIRFALISNNMPKKGIHDLIEIARICEDLSDQAEFLVIGPENQEIVRLKLAQNQGEIASNILFLGYMQSSAAAISEANVVLNLSSFAESFGRTVAEALVARRPVIAYEWGALPELIRHGINGFLAPYRDVKSVASFVRQICEDSSLIGTMGEAGRDFVIHSFTPQHLYDHLENIYQKVFAGRSSLCFSSESRLSQKVSIVIPIFNAYDEVKECIESVLRHTHSSYACIHLINDGSSDPRIKQLLFKYVGIENVKITHNAQNIGYTKTINIAIKENKCNDIVLLNSDTIVTRGWLFGLRASAYSSTKIATVTAMSDNAGAFSFPKQGIANPKPENVSYDDYATAIIQSSASCSIVDTPTGSGFCMYIRKQVLDEIGIFDEVAFPRGYGEENDFCMRATRAGWRNVITPWAFVFHKRNASFKSEKDSLIQPGINVVTQRYPDYAQRVKDAFSSPAMLDLRTKIEKDILLMSNR